MNIDVSDLPCETRQEVLDRADSTVGDEQHDRLVSRVGEEGLRPRPFSECGLKFGEM